MNDASPYRRAGASGLPPATLYDPADDRSTPFGSEPTGTVVLLLVGEADRRWAAAAAIELSAAWAAHGRRVVLADLHLETPLLHEPLGADNLEGVVDVFVYGASIARIARPVRGRGFYFIPAGTYTPDVEAVYHHRRWPKLIAGFRDASASLVLFAPAESADLEALAGWLDEVILLGPPREPESLAPLVAAGVEIRGLVVPPAGEAAPRASDEPPVAPPAPPRVFFPTQHPEEEDDELHLPPPPVRTPHRGNRIAVGALWALLAVALVAAVGYAVASLRPDLLPWAQVSAAPRADTASILRRPAAPPPAPVRGGEPLPYSVQVIAYRSLSAAAEQIERVRGQVPAVVFFASPAEIQGVLYYRVLAGALPDTAVAQEIKGVLVASGAIVEEDASSAWSLIQHAPLAFDLGEYPTREQAGAAADSLLDRRIPAYPVAVPYSDGTHRWQLYGGSYPDSAAAEPMRRILAEAGVQPRLVPRSGLSTAAAE